MGMVTTIATALTNLPTIVTDAISAGYDKIKGVVDNIPTYINNAYNWATSQISNITGAIGDKLKEAYSWATSNAGEIAKVVIGAFNPAIAPILEAVKIASENAGQIKEWLVGEYNALSAWISQMIAAFQSTYTSISGEIGSIIEPFITPIKAAIDAIRPLTEALDYYVTHPEILKAKAAQAIGAINEAMGEVVQDFCTDPLSPTVQSPRIGV
jgi:phage-related protein